GVGRPAPNWVGRLAPCEEAGQVINLSYWVAGTASAAIRSKRRYKPPRRHSQPSLRTLRSCEFLPKLLVLRARVGMFLGGFQRRFFQKSPRFTTHSGIGEARMTRKFSYKLAAGALSL